MPLAEHHEIKRHVFVPESIVASMMHLKIER